MAMKTLLLSLLLAATAIPACEGYDWDLWRECANSTRYVFSDVPEDAGEDDCLLMPRWESAGCAENFVKDVCSDEPEDSYDQCLNQKTNQLCCYRLTKCHQYTAEELVCSNYEANQNDIDACLDANTDVKNDCVEGCKAVHPVGPERRGCKKACRQELYAANTMCKRCHRCNTATNFCLQD